MTTTGCRGSGRPGQPVDRNPGAVDRIPADPRPEGWRLRLTAVVWGAGWELARRLPEGLVLRVADLFAVLASVLAKDALRRVRRNLSRVVPPEQLGTTARAAFRSYARYWVEAFRAADVPPAVIDERTRTVGLEHLDGALDRGKGVIILLAHHGSWDSAARWAETHGYHLAVVAEVLRPRALFARFVALREAIGLEVVPLRRGKGLTDRLEQVLAANHLVGLLTDRDLTGTAPVVTFFGEETRMPLGAVVLGQRTGAAVIPTTMRQAPGRGWELEFMAPVDVAGVPAQEAAQRVAAALERLISTAPAQWHAFSPVWLADLPPHKRRAQPGPQPQPSP